MSLVSYERLVKSKKTARLQDFQSGMKAAVCNVHASEDGAGQEDTNKQSEVQSLRSHTVKSTCTGVLSL